MDSQEPRLRLPGFTGDLQTFHIKEIADVSAGGDAPEDTNKELTEPTSEFPYPVFSNGIDEKAIYGFSKTYTYADPAITISARGTIGHTAVREGKFTPIVRLICVKPKGNLADLHYLKISLGNVRFDQGVGAIPQLTAPTVKKTKVSLPSIEEQEAIGEFFARVDEEIEAQKTALENIHSLKKSLLQRMFPREGASTPELRLPDFTSEWQEQSLGDIVEIRKSYPLTRSAERVEYTGYKYIHYGDIHTGVANIVTADSSIPNIEPGIYEYLQVGDLVLADASEDYKGIAEPSIILEIEDSINLIAGLHTIAIRPSNADSVYLYYLLKGNKFKKHGYRMGTGISVFGITSRNILKYTDYFPSLEEQEAIGKFFARMDELIAAHESKLEHLEQRKRTLLQQMFI